jgi:hypothetical protein
MLQRFKLSALVALALIAAPLQALAANCTVTDTIVGPDGEGVRGVRVEFIALAPQSVNNSIISSRPIVAKTDDNGVLRDSAGSVGVTFLQGAIVRVQSPELGFKGQKILIPATTSANLRTLVASYMTPGTAPAIDDATDIPIGEDGSGLTDYVSGDSIADVIEAINEAAGSGSSSVDFAAVNAALATANAPVDFNGETLTGVAEIDAAAAGALFLRSQGLFLRGPTGSTTYALLPGSNTPHLTLGSTGMLQWTSTTATGTPDTGIERIAAGVAGATNGAGTLSQFRVGTPSNGSDATTKTYTDAIVTFARVSAALESASAALDFNGQRLGNIAEQPLADTDAASRGFVWGRSGIHYVVQLATTANITLSGTQTIDGVSAAVGYRVLVKNQSTGSQNGIYLVASGAWTRATDMDAASEVLGLINVQEGSTNADTVWMVTNDISGTITLGSTSLTFAQIGSGGSGTPATTVTAVGTQAVGTSTNYAREDHIHGHGNQAGGSLHSNVSFSTAGFASNTDKISIESAISALRQGVRAVATSNITQSGTQTIDGVALSVSDRVLCAGQSTASQNGIWSVGAGAWARSNDMPASGITVAAGMLVPVAEGTTYADTLWQLTTDGTITVGSTSLAFARIDQAAITAGTGLTRSGNSIAITSGGVGSTEISDGSVALADMANLAQDQFIGRTTASTGVPQTATITAAARTVLDDTTVGAMKTTLGAENALTFSTGLSRSTDTITVANDGVDNTKLANMANATIKCRNTAGTGDPEDCTATQVTALLNAMVGDSGSGGTKGEVPAPASGDAAAGKFLKADGTWAVPAGGSSVLWTKDYMADQMLDVGTSWPTTAMADQETYNLVNVIAYDPSTSQGRGLEIVLPSGATTITLTIDAAAAASGFTTNNGIVMALDCRQQYGTGSFTQQAATAVTLTDNATIQRKPSPTR